MITDIDKTSQGNTGVIALKESYFATPASSHLVSEVGQSFQGGGHSNTPPYPQILSKLAKNPLPESVSAVLDQSNTGRVTQILQNNIHSFNVDEETVINIQTNNTEGVTDIIQNLSGSSNYELIQVLNELSKTYDVRVTESSDNKVDVEVLPPERKIDIGIDYLMGTLRMSQDNFNSFLEYICSTFQVELDFSEVQHRHGCYEYTNLGFSPVTGLKIYFSYDANGKVFASYIIPGKAVRPLSFYEVCEFITRSYHVYCAKFTRIDIKIDDYVRRASMAELLELAQKGDVANVEKYLYMTSGKVGDGGKSKSDSIYFGSKRRQLNVYNAQLLHEIPADRWEGRLRDERAESVVKYIANNFEDFHDDPREFLVPLLQYCAHKVLNIAKFVKRNGDKKQSVNRFEKYEFYESFFDDIGRIDPLLLKDEPRPHLNPYQFVVRSFDWLNRQVFKRLATLQKAFGVETFQQVYEKCSEVAYGKFSNQDFIRLVSTSSFIETIDPRNLPNFMALLTG